MGQGGSSVGCGGDFGGGCGGVGCGGSKGFGDRRGGEGVVEMIGYDVVGWCGWRMESILERWDLFE